MNKQLFSDVNAFLTGDIDKGLFIITGKLSNGISLEIAEEAIQGELNNIQCFQNKTELEKVKNKIEATLIFSEMSVLNKAMNLAFAELTGDASQINEENKNYQKVTSTMIRNQAKQIFKNTNCSSLYYHAIK